MRMFVSPQIAVACPNAREYFDGVSLIAIENASFGEVDGLTYSSMTFSRMVAHSFAWSAPVDSWSSFSTKTNLTRNCLE